MSLTVEAREAPCASHLARLAFEKSQIANLETQLVAEHDQAKNPVKFSLSDFTNYPDFKLAQKTYIPQLATALEISGLDFQIKTNRRGLPYLLITGGTTWLGQVIRAARKRFPALTFVYDPSQLSGDGLPSVALYDSNQKRIYLSHSSMLSPQQMQTSLLHELRHAYVDLSDNHPLEGAAEVPDSDSHQLPRGRLLNNSGYDRFQSFDEALAFLTEAIAIKAQLSTASSYSRDKKSMLNEFIYTRSMSMAASRRNIRMFQEALKIVESALDGKSEAQQSIKIDRERTDIPAYSATIKINQTHLPYQLRFAIDKGADRDSEWTPQSLASLRTLQNLLREKIKLSNRLYRKAMQLKPHF